MKRIKSVLTRIIGNPFVLLFLTLLGLYIGLTPELTTPYFIIFISYLSIMAVLCVKSMITSRKKIMTLVSKGGKAESDSFRQEINDALDRGGFPKDSIGRLLIFYLMLKCRTYGDEDRSIQKEIAEIYKRNGLRLSK